MDDVIDPFESELEEPARVEEEQPVVMRKRAWRIALILLFLSLVAVSGTWWLINAFGGGEAYFADYAHEETRFYEEIRIPEDVVDQVLGSQILSEEGRALLELDLQEVGELEFSRNTRRLITLECLWALSFASREIEVAATINLPKAQGFEYKKESPPYELHVYLLKFKHPGSAKAFQAAMNRELERDKEVLEDYLYLLSESKHVDPEKARARSHRECELVDDSLVVFGAKKAVDAFLIMHSKKDNPEALSHSTEYQSFKESFHGRGQLFFFDTRNEEMAAYFKSQNDDYFASYMEEYWKRGMLYDPMSQILKLGIRWSALVGFTGHYRDHSLLSLKLKDEVAAHQKTLLPGDNAILAYFPHFLLSGKRVCLDIQALRALDDGEKLDGLLGVRAGGRDFLGGLLLSEQSQRSLDSMAGKALGRAAWLHKGELVDVGILELAEGKSDGAKDAITDWQIFNSSEGRPRKGGETGWTRVLGHDVLLFNQAALILKDKMLISLRMLDPEASDDESEISERSSSAQKLGASMREITGSYLESIKSGGFLDSAQFKNFDSERVSSDDPVIHFYWPYASEVWLEKRRDAYIQEQIDRYFEQVKGDENEITTKEGRAAFSTGRSHLLAKAHWVFASTRMEDGKINHYSNEKHQDIMAADALVEAFSRKRIQALANGIDKAKLQKLMNEQTKIYGAEQVTSDMGVSLWRVGLSRASQRWILEQNPRVARIEGDGVLFDFDEEEELVGFARVKGEKDSD